MADLTWLTRRGPKNMGGLTHHRGEHTCFFPAGKASSMPDRTVNAMLKDKFETKHADAAVRHFTRMVQDFQQREWEDANAKAGRFVEAALKAVWRETGKPVPKG